MRLLFIALFVAAVPRLSGQAPAVDWFTDYNPHITAAEEALLRHHPNVALDHYQRAFLVGSDPHNHDLYNAALAAHSANRVDLLRRYLGELVQQGVPVKYFEQQYAILNHPGMNWEVLRKKLLAFEQQYLDSYDNACVACFNGIAYRDKVVRTADPPADVRATQDSLNMAGLTDCIAAYGFPSQRRLGLISPMELQYPYYLPLRQELQRVNESGNDRFGFLPLLDSLARSGVIETEIYIDLMTTQHSRIGRAGGYGHTSVIGVQGGSNRLYRVVYPAAAIERFNANRRLLGVRSFEAYTALLIRYFTEGFGQSFPYHLPRRQTLVAYPVEELRGIDLEVVGELRTPQNGSRK